MRPAPYNSLLLAAACVWLAGCIDSLRGDTPPCETGCLIDDACVPAGEDHPSDQCLACDPDSDPVGWSPAHADAPCDDGDECTLESACSAGECVGVREPECTTPLLECATDVVCDELGCDYVPKPDFCVHEGVCVEDGDLSPVAGCQRCDASADPHAMVPIDGGGCDDGDPCTDDDACVTGVCEGVPRECDDGLACTDDYCSGGECLAELQAGACLIEGQCHPENGLKPLSPCEACVPTRSSEQWSVLPDEAICDVGDVCRAPGLCKAGSCDADLLKIDPEPNSTLGDAAALAAGPNGFNSPFPAGTVRGNINPAWDVDWFSYSVPSIPKVVTSVKVRVKDYPAGETFFVCLSFSCGRDASDAQAPVVTCQGASVEEDGFAGCCAKLGGPGPEQLTITPACVGQVTGDLVGRTAVVLQRAGEGTDPCSKYSLEWGVQ